MTKKGEKKGTRSRVKPIKKPSLVPPVKPPLQNMPNKIPEMMIACNEAGAQAVQKLCDIVINTRNMDEIKHIMKSIRILADKPAAPPDPAEGKKD